MVQKAEVEIKEKEKTPQEQAMDAALKRLEKPIQPPPIEETLDKVKQALAQAKKSRTPVKQTWYCTNCGSAHIQIDAGGSGGHFSVDALDGEFVDANTGQPLGAHEKSVMESYAVPIVESGQGHAQSRNAKTLAKMRELKGK